MSDLPSTRFGEWTTPELRSFLKRYYEPLVNLVTVWLKSGRLQLPAHRRTEDRGDLAKELVSGFIQEQASTERWVRVGYKPELGNGFRGYLWQSLRYSCIRQLNHGGPAAEELEERWSDPSADFESDVMRVMTRLLLGWAREDFEQTVDTALVEILDLWFPKNPDQKPLGRGRIAERLGLSPASVGRRQDAIKRLLMQSALRLSRTNRDQLVEAGGGSVEAEELVEELTRLWSICLDAEGEEANE